MRIYSSYSQAEMDAIEAEAKKYGMSLSGFQRYVTLLAVKLPAGTQNMATLTADATAAILQKKSGETFVVSSLLPAEVWASLNRSQKQTISQVLKKYAEANPHIVVYTGLTLGNRTKIYQKL